MTSIKIAAVIMACACLFAAFVHGFNPIMRGVRPSPWLWPAFFAGAAFLALGALAP